jgi:hypothetical protein
LPVPGAHAVCTLRGGGFWEHRFKNQCMERGGLDEDEIYEVGLYKPNPVDPYSLKAHGFNP